MWGRRPNHSPHPLNSPSPAAASAQYIISKWAPGLLINIGTCGGIEGEIEKGTIVLADRLIVYDFGNLMASNDRVIAHYTTNLDLSWLGGVYPQEVRKTLLVSGDRDLSPEQVPWLKARFGAVTGDWETGAIGWVAARNKTRCLILRGVTDLVSEHGGEAYDGTMEYFLKTTEPMMRRLLGALPAWIAQTPGQCLGSK